MHYWLNLVTSFRLNPYSKPRWACHLGWNKAEATEIWLVIFWKAVERDRRIPLALFTLDSALSAGEVVWLSCSWQQDFIEVMENSLTAFRVNLSDSLVPITLYFVPTSICINEISRFIVRLQDPGSLGFTCLKFEPYASLPSDQFLSSKGRECSWRSLALHFPPLEATFPHS